MYCVYEIFNKVTGRKYIGMTINHTNRFNAHMSQLNYGTHKERLMQRDYILYGRDSFDYRLLEFVDNKVLAHQREIHYMKINKTYLEDFGYNSQDPFFNKYQNKRKPVNSQNYFYEKIKETGMSLSKFAASIGISRKSLVHGMIHPRTMSAIGFCKMVNALPLNKDEVSRFMGWIIDPTKYYSEEEKEMIKKFSQLSEDNQNLVLEVMQSMVSK